MSTSDKKTARILSSVFKSHEIRDVVISPGSRNAPLIIALAGDDYFNCYTIVDERSAGFFALGMAIEKKQPVALVCTSGSALLNYYPAVSESFYRHIPLVVVSADRPAEMMDQGDGQTIRQNGALDKHVNYSCSLPSVVYDEQDEWYVNRLINEAVINCHVRKRGPVHINIPFKEPLYGKTGMTADKTRVIEYIEPAGILNDSHLNKLAEIWNNSENVLILLGENEGSGELRNVLKKLAETRKAVVLTETLTNIAGENILPCIDRMVSTISEEEYAVFRPDLLITTEGAVVSKMVKTFLRKNPPRYHWHVSKYEPLMDTYMHLTHSIPVKLEQLTSQLLSLINKNGKNRYFEFWNNRFEMVSRYHNEYLKQTPWSDLKVFDVLQKMMPEQYKVHWGNSTVVRYAQLFERFYKIRNYSNRGTSGIDGTVSTAIGAAYVSGDDMLLVTGDLSFMYDSNGLWNKYLTANLKIIVVNNGGGGIFRFIPGPSESGHLEDYFEVTHSKSIQPLAEMYGLNYLCATSGEEFETLLSAFLEEKNRPSIMEVITPAKENAKVLKKYFEHLKEIK
ncbi:MAG: 2-succinyl-5-enolpyruvyl-6-hydroxy-3-cyclohexene-1-carboxylic-acid synthase [Chlorobi bacterium]|nr:2-succinyl-5-enolpyruvyl-6-hydroxy-3-cyclohexene-1-carboxylic-acid synthase [Chlorobiota bacterium]